MGGKSTISDRETRKDRVDVALVVICIKNLISELSMDLKINK